MAEQIVELAPDESKEVSFEAIPKEVKTYSVSVNGLGGSFKAIAPAVPQWVLPTSDDGGFSYPEEAPRAYDDNPDTYARGNAPQLGYSPVLELSITPPIYCGGLKYMGGYIRYMYPIVIIEVGGNGIWEEVYREKGFYDSKMWHLGTFEPRWITGARIKVYNPESWPTPGEILFFRLREFRFLKGVLPPEHPLWEVSEVTAVGADLPTWCGTCWMLCSISVTNLSSSPAPCSVALHSRYFMSPDYTWTDWREHLPKSLSSYRNAVSDYQAALDKYDQLTMLEATLAPGETKVFSGVIPNMVSKRKGMPRHWVKFVGPFGEVLAPSYFLMVEY